MNDYMRALHQRFFREPDVSELEADIENTRQEVRDCLDKMQRRRLMHLVDSQNLLKEEISLASFTAGFKLAWGLSRELEVDGLYSFDEEETDWACRQMREEEEMMGKRRPSGDGMVRKREDGRWEGRIVVGHKENGDSIFRYVYADTQKELTAKLRQNIDAYQGVDLTEDSQMTLGQWLDRWLDRMTGVVGPLTMKRYEGTVVRHIKPYLGEKIISQVTGKDIQKLYDILARHGNRITGEGLASGTIRGIHAMFHDCLLYTSDAADEL